MKIFKYSFGLLLGAVVFLSSCRDFVEPSIPYTTFNTGAYLRTIERTSTTFNIFNLGSAKFEIKVEAVDAEDGATVETVEVRVRHRRLIPNVGLNYTPATDVIVKTLQKSDFAPNADSRFLRSTIVVTAAEALAAVGLTAAGISGGDVFEFRLVLNDRFGRVFTDSNKSGDLTAPFYNSPFFYPVSVVCPSDLAGTFDYITTNGTAFGTSSGLQSCPGSINGKVTLAAVSGTPGAYAISDATFGVWKCLGDPEGVATGIRLRDTCEKLSFSGSDAYAANYTLSFVSVNATDLKFNWSNNFGEAGAVTLKSNAGKPWPTTLK